MQQDPISSTQTMSHTGDAAHILVFPYPAQGHMLPLLDLTHQLFVRGLDITILVTPKNLPILNPLLSTHPSIKTLVLPLPNHPSIPPGIENLKDLPIGGFRAFMTALRGLYDPILQWFLSHPSPPIAILSDFFLGWTHHLASQLGIPRIVFSSSAAVNLSLTSYLWRDIPTRDDPNDPNFSISFPKVPKSPTYPWWQLSNIYRSYIPGDPESELLRDGFLANLASWGIVFNSFTDLEGEYLRHMMEYLGHDRIWAVGPLLPPVDDPAGQTERGGFSTVAADDVISWLDKCKDHSVVYACFGSQAVLTNEQMAELASGLDQSGVRFIWSVKEATSGHVDGKYGVIPTGFEDRVAGRGLVIRGWTPQVLILRHRSVGAFLTHCGWNSVLEAIVAGVPMLAWPMTADQFANARLLVKEMGMAVKVCEGQDALPNSTKLATAIAGSVGEDKSKRVRAMELREVALNAVKIGGTSFKDLDGLVTSLRGN